MLECLLLGDSIALGAQQFKPECVAYAQNGINSRQWNKKFLQSDQGNNLNAKTVIISLGSNDHLGIRTIYELQEIRKKVKADHVFWILPAGNNPTSGVDIEWMQSFIKVVAGEYGDTVIPIKHLQKDGIHPSREGYKEIVSVTK